MRTLQEVRDALYVVNAQNLSLRMIALNQRDDKIIYDTNQCLGELLKWLDELIEESGSQHATEVSYHTQVAANLRLQKQLANVVAAKDKALGALKIVAAKPFSGRGSEYWVKLSPEEHYELCDLVDELSPLADSCPHCGRDNTGYPGCTSDDCPGNKGIT